MQFKVIREYWAGGKFSVGDIVEAEPQQVAHLIGTRLKAVKAKKKPDGDSQS